MSIKRIKNFLRTDKFYKGWWRAVIYFLFRNASVSYFDFLVIYAKFYYFNCDLSSGILCCIKRANIYLIGSNYCQIFQTMFIEKAQRTSINFNFLFILNIECYFKNPALKSFTSPTLLFLPTYGTKKNSNRLRIKQFEIYCYRLLDCYFTEIVFRNPPITLVRTRKTRMRSWQIQKCQLKKA